VGNDGTFHPETKDAVPSWLVMSTEKAVRQILRAAARGKPEAIITNHGKIIVAIERFAPWLIRLAERKLIAAS
jgi:short-subunit dehydrogenase